MLDTPLLFGGEDLEGGVTSVVAALIFLGVPCLEFPRAEPLSSASVLAADPPLFPVCLDCSTVLLPACTWLEPSWFDDFVGFTARRRCIPVDLGVRLRGVGRKSSNSKYPALKERKLRICFRRKLSFLLTVPLGHQFHFHTPWDSPELRYPTFVQRRVLRPR